MNNNIVSRKYYIDNLRTFIILLLFPFHIFMIYNNWGENFYIHGEALLIPSLFNRFANIFMMPTLFTVSGISSRYALEKRSAGEYLKERFCKLLLPFIFGVLLVVPVQTYIAGIYWNGQANYFESFTKITDLSGYDGAFTPGHLWFILYLFVISVVCLPFLIWYKNKGKGTLGNKVPLILVILLGLLPCISQNELFKVINISGKSILEDSVYFLLGYFFLYNDNLLEKLERYRFFLLGLFVVYIAFMVLILDMEFYEMAPWLSILTLLGLARRYLNFNGKISDYLSKSSFGIYIFHQSWIVIMAFLIFKFTENAIFQIILVLFSSIIMTFFTYEICRRVSVLRLMFGLKKLGIKIQSGF